LFIRRPPIIRNVTSTGVNPPRLVQADLTPDVLEAVEDEDEGRDAEL
jgi:hypothetical protein